MKFYDEIFTTEGGDSPLYPPKLTVPIVIGVDVLSPQVCDRLAREILKREKKLLKEHDSVPVAGVEKGLSTRWLGYNILSWDIPEIRDLKNAIITSYTHYLKVTKCPRWKNEIQCWANVFRKGESFHPHHHNFRHRPVLSCTVSLTTSPTATACHLPFRMLARDGQYINEINIPTTRGNIIMFPGWLTHYTTPQTGTKPRITIGLDIASGLTTGTRLPFDKGRGKITV